MGGGGGRRTRDSRGSPRLKNQGASRTEERYALRNPPCRGIPVRGCRPASRCLKAVVLRRLLSQLTGPGPSRRGIGVWMLIHRTRNNKRKGHRRPSDGR